MTPLNIHWKDTVGSTNDICMKAALGNEAEGYVIAAKFQEQGRGQRGNTWEAEYGINLTFSILFRPSFLRVDQQFMISKIVAISICEWLRSLNIIAKIKWPNDIYVNDQKIGGVLIENSLCASVIDISVVGIGVNVNQTAFSSDIPNPTSIFLQLNQRFKPEQLLPDYLNFLFLRYHELRTGLFDKISLDYFELLYRKDNYYRYSSNDGEFDARIVGIKPTGELLLETTSGDQKSFGFKEVVFIMKN